MTDDMISADPQDLNQIPGPYYHTLFNCCLSPVLSLELTQKRRKQGWFGWGLTARVAGVVLRAGNSGDPRTKDKLVDGVNVTVDDRHMWLIPYTFGQVSHVESVIVACVALSD